jgi:hypothetical protein
MSAQDHLQQEQYTQLPMFIPAHQLVESGEFNSVDLGRGVTSESWDDKREDNKSPRPGQKRSFNREIAQDGVKRPANIIGMGVVRGTPSIGNGHHRIAALHTKDRNSEVPVIHHTAQWDGIDGGMGREHGFETDDEFERSMGRTVEAIDSVYDPSNPKRVTDYVAAADIEKRTGKEMYLPIQHAEF